MPLRYMRREGPNLILELTTWGGPIEAGRQGRYHTEILKAPIDQRRIQRHPRHITAWRIDDTIDCCHPAACISPSVSGYREVARRFRFGSRESNRVSEGVE